MFTCNLFGVGRPCASNGLYLIASTLLHAPPDRLDDRHPSPVVGCVVASHEETRFFSVVSWGLGSTNSMFFSGMLKSEQILADGYYSVRFYGENTKGFLCCFFYVFLNPMFQNPGKI